MCSAKSTENNKTCFERIRTGRLILNVVKETLNIRTSSVNSGCIITNDNRTSTGIRTRIALAKRAFANRKQLLLKFLKVVTRKEL